MAARVVLTYADYAAIPADGRRYELHEGELWVMPAPTTPHQRFLRKLLMALSGHVDSQGLGEVFISPVDCILSDTTVVQPDILFVDREGLWRISERGIEGPPTLVVEALSRSTARVDRGIKLQLYARYAVPFYWIADLEARRIEAYRLDDGRYELAAELSGSTNATLPPFPDLLLTPLSLWD
jgi:Uma2 family endonuclease